MTRRRPCELRANCSRAIRIPAAVRVFLALSLAASGPVAAQGAAAPSAPAYELDDAHFHLTNSVQEGADIGDFLRIMGARVGRAALFGLPLQQTWSYQNSGDLAPTCYLQTDVPLYYYSFTDAYIAMAYRSLSRSEQARFYPMITGFNPADTYATDRIKAGSTLGSGESEVITRRPATRIVGRREPFSRREHEEHDKDCRRSDRPGRIRGGDRVRGDVRHPRGACAG